jgi:type II secretory pathway pseudopilin PulG
MRLTTNTIEREPLEGGFSLIEVLVAAGLLVGSLAALAFVFVFATRANADAQHTTYATVLAMQKMEELRADFAPIHVVEAVDYADIRGTVLVGQSDPPQAVYERRWTVEPLLTAPNALVIVVTVTLARRHLAQHATQVRLITLRAVPAVVQEGTS